MSFTWFSNVGPLRTREQIAREVHEVSLNRRLDETATVIALMTISTEVGTGSGVDRKWWCPANHANEASFALPHDSVADDANSVGYFQQRKPWWGSTEDMMTLGRAANEFLERLTPVWYRAKNDPQKAGEFAQQVQGSAFPDRYVEKWDECWGVLRRALSDTGSGNEEVPVTVERYDFNEYPRWCENSSSRRGVPVDLFLLHTEEGGGGDDAADDLASFLISTHGGSNPVSYHYTISQASDGGVTVVDVVDTDYAAWAVGNADDRSINLCFAGSRASWTRSDWMKQSKAIDVAAYLAVQDCEKYGIAPHVMQRGSYGPPPGISDHYYVTDFLNWGSHTDVGVNFPWDYFKSRIAFWWDAADPDQSDTPPPPPRKKESPEERFEKWLDAATDHDLLRYIAEQLGPGHPVWKSKGETLRDRVWGL